MLKTRIRQAVAIVLAALLLSTISVGYAAATDHALNKWQSKPYAGYNHYIGYHFASGFPTSTAWRDRVKNGAAKWNAVGTELYFANVSDSSSRDYMDIRYEDLLWPNGDKNGITSMVSVFGEVFGGNIAFNKSPDCCGCGGLSWYTGTGTSLPACSTDLYWTAIHEFGHAVMIGHSTRSSDTADIMWPSVTVSTAKRTLTAHDKATINAMY